MYTAILAGIKRGFLETYTQAAFVIIRVVWVMLIAFIFYKLWTSIVDNPAETLAYIAVGEAFYFTGRGNVAWRIERDYNTGYLDVRLLRPVPLWLQYFAETVGPGMFNYALTMAFIAPAVYAITGVATNPITVLVAYLLYATAKHALYFTVGSLVVDMGRTRFLRWLIARLDTVTILVPAAVVGALAYKIIPNAYAYYWPAHFAVNGVLPAFWWAGTGIMILAMLWAENHIRRKIEVFGG